MKALILGYGNEIRGDDAAGPQVAWKVESWGVPGVRAVATHQLTPELASEIAEVDLVVFVDAYPAAEGQGVQVVAQEPSTSQSGVGHAGDPPMLLEMTRAVYGRCPAAYLVAVPGVDFDFGTTLSPRAQQGVEEALEAIKELLTPQQDG